MKSAAVLASFLTAMVVVPLGVAVESNEVLVDTEVPLDEVSAEGLEEALDIEPDDLASDVEEAVDKERKLWDKTLYYGKVRVSKRGHGFPAIVA